MIYYGLKHRVHIYERRCTLWGVDVMAAMIISMIISTTISTIISMIIVLLVLVLMIVLIIVVVDATGSGMDVAGVANAGQLAMIK